jgi:hypothetical protein
MSAFPRVQSVANLHTCHESKYYTQTTRVYLSFELMSSTCYYEKEKDRQCTYNVTVRPIRATIVAVKLNKYYIFWVCICSLRYTARKTHEPCCHLWPVLLCNMSPYHRTNDFLRKKLLNIKYFGFIYKFFSEIFLILRRNGQHTIKKVYWFPCKVPVILVRF